MKGIGIARHGVVYQQARVDLVEPNPLGGGAKGVAKNVTGFARQRLLPPYNERGTE